MRVLERVRGVIRTAEQQHCRVRRIRLPLWAYFELMCDFQAAGAPLPIGNEVALVCGVPVLRDNATELALDRLGRQLRPISQAAPVLH
jgi:hypothetical protein